MANEKLVGLICRRVAGPAGGPYVGIREIVSALAAALRDDQGAVEALSVPIDGIPQMGGAAVKRIADYLTKGD